SLDPSDDDPARFFAYFQAALQTGGETSGEGIGSPGEGMRPILPFPPVETWLLPLLNDIQNRGYPNLLVLDDFQVIKDDEILMAIGLLIANQPGNLHLVLITREDPPLPLARLRANNRLTEVRADDLRFTRGETEDFLLSMGLSLSVSDLTALADRTEGWVVGLQLAGLSMRGRADISDFITRLSGSHRYILSYLTEEVLNRQPDDIQTFLLHTSILNRLNGELCDAVTGRSDSAALLERLFSANLFLTQLDDEQRWYRFHPLFLDLLTSRLRALHGERIPELHRRASQWFARACEQRAFGERADLAGQAIEHALTAEDYSAAVRLIETHVVDVMNQWYAKTVSAWMKALPPEWSARSPRTNLAFARMHFMQGEIAQASPYLERLQALFSGSPGGEDDRSGQPLQYKAEWLGLQSSLSCAQGKPAEAMELAKQALDYVTRDDANALGQVYLALAVAYQQMGDIRNAEDAYQKLIQSGQASDNIVMELLGISALALMVIQRGRLHHGFDLASRGAARAERMGVQSPICAGIYGELGQACFHWCDFDQAEGYFQRAAHLSGMGSFSDAEIFDAVARSRLYQIRGDWDAAARELQKAVDFMRADAPVVVREEIVAQQVNVFLAQNNLAAAEHTLFQETNALQGKAAFPDLVSGQSIPYPQGPVYISGLRILLYRARSRGEPGGVLRTGGLPDGLGFADRLLGVLLQDQYVPLAIETLLLRAQLHEAQGDSSAGLTDVAATLDMAEPEGYLSQFVMEGRPVADLLAHLLEGCKPGSTRAEFIRRILGVNSLARPTHPIRPIAPVGGRTAVALAESLTSRELDVLRLMVEGKTYEDVAGQLVVSINTVRTHVKSIYGKLGVNNRTAAIEAARQMNLL
ncbi:MAG TPA: LuxR C-terminal-related transcriptional regulator, partial [Anaerolinea sp.]|nr:LuxR C-terminal-related transcriptional regulator [Anaerolinea sp.]